MSIINRPIFKKEDGTQNNPAVTEMYSTHCYDTKLREKKFKTVFITWVVNQWNESSVFTSGSIPALRVDNVCDGSYAYLKVSPEDFKAVQQCCTTEDRIFVNAYDEAFV